MNANDLPPVIDAPRRSACSFGQVESGEQTLNLEKSVLQTVGVKANPDDLTALVEVVRLGEWFVGKSKLLKCPSECTKPWPVPDGRVGIPSSDVIPQRINPKNGRIGGAREVHLRDSAVFPLKPCSASRFPWASRMSHAPTTTPDSLLSKAGKIQGCQSAFPEQGDCSTTCGTSGGTGCCLTVS